MRQAALFATLAALVVALLTGAPVAQEPQPASAFVAFRADRNHVVATLKVSAEHEQVTDGLSPAPIARYGYPYYDAPPRLRTQNAIPDIRDGERWLIHVAPGRTFPA